MSWKKGFYAALLKFLREEMGKDDAVEVTGFEQETREGYKYTTWTQDPSETVIVITYRSIKGNSRLAEWRGDFGELIRSLGE